MRRSVALLPLVVFAAVAVAWALGPAGPATSLVRTVEHGQPTGPADPDPTPGLDLDFDLDLPGVTPVKGKPGGDACCDPAAEPGVGGNPFCFEGHTCCSDGVWRCNNPDATPSCDPGEVCDGSGCGGRGDACGSGSDCCSGTCKKGRCR